MGQIKFYCINLKERRDRRAKARRLFKRLGLQVEFWTVDRHPEGGRYGCFESHVQIWLLSRGEITVIMEDDLEFAGSKSDFWTLIQEGASLTHDYEIVGLGRIPVSSGRQISPHFREGRFVALSCYMGRTETLRRLAERVIPYYGMHVDTVVSFSSRQVGLIDNLFNQEFTDSNNSWTDNIPIVSLLKLDQHFRELLQRDSLALTKLPGWVWPTLTTILIGLRTFQRGLTESFYRRPVEFRDRRV